MISRRGLNLPRNIQVASRLTTARQLWNHTAREKKKKPDFRKESLKAGGQHQWHKGRRVFNRGLSCWLSAPSLAVRFIGRDSGLLSFRQNRRRLCWVNTVHPERALAKCLSSPFPLPAEKSKGMKWQLEKASWLLTTLWCSALWWSQPQLLSQLQGTIILVLNWRFRRAY